MPYQLDLTPALQRQRWKVKIRECERLEPPHVTIIRRLQTWRIDLRNGSFMDREPAPRDVPGELVQHIRDHLEELRAAWDEMYPENPVGGER